jgi:Ras-related protein Rap-1A
MTTKWGKALFRYPLFAKHFGAQSVPIVVVGANSELYNEREVLPSTIVNLSQQWNLPFFEVSARRNWHVSDAFEDLVRQMRNRYPEHPVKTKKRSKPQCIIM